MLISITIFISQIISYLLKYFNNYEIAQLWQDHSIYREQLQFKFSFGQHQNCLRSHTYSSSLYLHYAFEKVYRVGYPCHSFVNILFLSRIPILCQHSFLPYSCTSTIYVVYGFFYKLLSYEHRCTNCVYVVKVPYIFQILY